MAVSLNCEGVDDDVNMFAYGSAEGGFEGTGGGEKLEGGGGGGNVYDAWRIGACGGC